MYRGILQQVRLRLGIWPIAGLVFWGSALYSLPVSSEPAAPSSDIFQKIEALWNDPPEKSAAYYVGASFSQNWSNLYFVGIKPLAANKNTDQPHIGWQIRAFSSSGTYHYITGNQKITGVSFSNEAMIGYQYNIGPLWSKLYAGTHRETHILNQIDPENTVQGEKWGAKTIWENWLNIGQYGFASADISYSTVFQQKSAFIRTGLKYGHFLTGIEGKYFGNSDYGTLSAGVFIQWDGPKFGSSLAGGFLKNQSGDNGEKNLYTRLTFSARF